MFPCHSRKKKNSRFSQCPQVGTSSIFEGPSIQSTWMDPYTDTTGLPLGENRQNVQDVST